MCVCERVCVLSVSGGGNSEPLALTLSRSTRKQEIKKQNPPRCFQINNPMEARKGGVERR